MPSTDAGIEHLARRMIERTLPKVEWTHRAHWALALWIIRHRPDLAGPSAMRDLITRYNEATGTPNTDSEGYHHTITLASMQGARAAIDAHRPDVSLAQILDEVMASRLGARDWMLGHWQRETLFSAGARREWVEPDLSPLAF